LSALLTTIPLSATGPFCTSFAFLADSEEAPLPLIEKAYLGLLESGAPLSPATLEKMKGDPFAVPEQADADFHTLRKNLAELKRMLEAKHWLDESVTKYVSSLLEARLRGMDVAADNQAVVNVQTGRTIFPLPGDLHHVTVDPSGRQLISVDQSSGAYLTGRVIDLDSGKLSPFRSEAIIEGGDAFYGKMGFSSSKQELFLMTQNEIFISVPFKDGALQWSRAKPKGNAYVLRTNEGPDTDGRYAFGRDALANGKIYRQSLKNFKRTSIDIPGIGDPGPHVKLEAYGQVPGSERIWVSKTIATAIPEKFTVETRSVVETYELKRKSIFSSALEAVKPIVALSKPAHSHVYVHWTDKGELVVKDGPRIEKWIHSEKSEVLFDSLKQKPSLEPEALVSNWKIQGNVYVELLRDQFNSPKRWVRTIDLTTGNVLSETEAPSGSDSVQLTPDGKQFIFASSTAIHLMPHVPAKTP